MKRRLVLPLLLLIAAGTGVYINTLDGEWVWDDASSILLHRHVQDPSRFAQLFREDQHAFGRGQGNFYRPLVSASFMLDYQLSGGPRPAPDQFRPPMDLSPRWFHVSNIFWHVLAACLFYLLMIRLEVPVASALLAALIYTVHPLHTEAVAYISGRADMMSAAFMYAGLLTGIYAVSRPSWGYAGFPVLFFAMALLSKESSLIFPVLWIVVLILVYLNQKQQDELKKSQWSPFNPHTVILTGAIAVTLILYLVLRNTVLYFGGSDAGGSVKGLGTRLVETGQAFTLYLGLLFYPSGLHMERSLDGFSVVYSYIGWFLIFLSLALIWFTWRKRWYFASAGMIWFLAAWLPISGIYPLNAPMGEHWMYVPMAGFWLSAITLLWTLIHSDRLKGAFCILIGLFVVFLGMLTIDRNRVWHDNETLFRDTLAHNPNSIRVHYNLAVMYEDLKQNWSGARRHYNRVLALQSVAGPGAGGVPDLELRLALARVCERMGRFSEAAVHYAELATRTDTLLLGVQGLARCMLAMGDGASAFRLREKLGKVSETQPEAVAWLDRLLAGEVFFSGREIPNSLKISTL